MTTRDIHIHMNTATRDAMSKMHDSLFYGVDSLPRCIFNLARSNDQTSSTVLFGSYTFVDDTLEDGEVEMFKDGARIRFFKLSTLNKNPFFLLDK